MKLLFDSLQDYVPERELPLATLKPLGCVAKMLFKVYRFKCSYSRSQWMCDLRHVSLGTF